MRAEYDFSGAKKNPYAKKLKKQITINIDSDAIDYFKELSSGTGIPYQTLINLYLSDCAANRMQLRTTWSGPVHATRERRRRMAEIDAREPAEPTAAEMAAIAAAAAEDPAETVALRKFSAIHKNHKQDR